MAPGVQCWGAAGFIWGLYGDGATQVEGLELGGCWYSRDYISLFTPNAQISVSCSCVFFLLVSICSCLLDPGCRQRAADVST